MKNETTSKLQYIKTLEAPFERLGMEVNNYNTRCPVHGGSDSVNCNADPESGVILWRCFNKNCDTGGTIVDLYMHVHAVDQAEAIRMLLEEYDSGRAIAKPRVDFNKYKKEEELEPTTEEPPPIERVRQGTNLRSQLTVRFKNSTQTEKVAIRDASFITVAPFLLDGELRAVGVLRWDKRGEKALLQCFYDGNEWIGGVSNFLNKRPIYKMGEIVENPERPVILVEGEKCMVHLQKACDDAHYKYEDSFPKVIVTSTIGGSNSLSKSELSILKHHRSVFLIPDEDDAGHKYAGQLKKILPQLRVLNLGIRPKEDVYDWLQDGGDVRKIFRVEEVEIAPEASTLLEKAVMTAASITDDQLYTFMKDMFRLEPNAVEKTKIFNALKENLDLTKGELNQIWREIKLEGAEDWPTLVARRVRVECYNNLAIYTTKNFWIWSGTHWEKHDDEPVHKVVNEYVIKLIPPGEMDFTIATQRAVYSLICQTAEQGDVLNMTKAPKPIINCRNGELHIDRNTGEVQLKPHNPKNYMTYCLDVDYDPESTCPEYDKAVRDIFMGDEDLVRHWHETAGYIIQPTRDFKNFFIGYGQKGHNGKTSLFRVVTELVGSDNIHSTRMKDFGGTQFDTSALVGKVMLLDDDLDKGVRLSDGLLKSLSEQKLISAQYKGKPIFQFVSYAAPVILTNHWPSTTDLTKAMFTRANIIPFNAYFDPEDPKTDKQLFDRIIKNELSGVLNHFIAGLQRLRERGRWEYPKACIEARESWMNDTNNFYLFARTMLEPCEGGMVYARDVRDCYRNWCNEQDIPDRYRLNARTFKGACEELGMVVTGANNNRGGWKIEGYRIVAE